MPVFVEWQWKGRTKSFLVIFHFYDDFSKPNLRIKKYEKKQLVMVAPSGILEPRKAWMTWASSHLELALLSELLCYANIINGLKEYQKRGLKPKLEGVKGMEREGDKDVVIIEDFNKEIGKDKKTVFYVEHGEPVHIMHCCVELCPEYIDYLKRILKPYLKD